AVKVAKNRLAKLSLQGTSAEAIADLLKGQTCIAYSGDPISAAKISVKYAKENNKLVILGGAMGDAVLDTRAVQALADLPSLDELRATLIGLLQAPATKIARVLKEPGAQPAPGRQAHRPKRTDRRTPNKSKTRRQGAKGHLQFEEGNLSMGELGKNVEGPSKVAVVEAAGPPKVLEEKWGVSAAAAVAVAAAPGAA